MELFHLHLLGNHDSDYKENKTIIVDPKKFNNTLYKRIYDMNPTVEIKEFPSTMSKFNRLCELNGIQPFEDRVNLGEIIGFMQDKYVCPQQEIKLANKLAMEKLLQEGINLRELAMEEYRSKNCPEIYSRLHSLFACDEKSLDFWLHQIRDNELDIFRIDVEDEPFHSSENLLPDESLSYGQKIEASRQYFHPRAKDLGTFYDEYLVQGKVLIKEKIGEARFEKKNR